MKITRLVLLLMALFQIIAWVQPISVFAANDFSCEITGSDIGVSQCDIFTSRCNRDYESDRSLCNNLPTDRCSSTTFPCKPKELRPTCPSGTRYFIGVTPADAKCCKCADDGCNSAIDCQYAKVVGVCPPVSVDIEYTNKEGVCIGVAKETLINKVHTCFDAACDTAIGKIRTDPGGFISDFYKYALMLAGLSLIITLIAIGYKVLTSQGNPEKLQAAKEMAGSLIGGLLLILFSFVLLKAIGVNILGLPGFR